MADTWILKLINEIDSQIELLKSMKENLIKNSFQKSKISIDSKWRILLKLDTRNKIKLKKSGNITALYGKNFLIIPFQEEI